MDELTVEIREETIELEEMVLRPAQNDISSDTEKNEENYDKGKPLHCSKCDTKFTQKTSLKRHVETVHEESLKQKGTKPICTLCNKALATNSSLRTHTKSVHEGKRPYKCNKCEQMFVNSTVLKRHIRGIHEGEKPFRCDIETDNENLRHAQMCK